MIHILYTGDYYYLKYDASCLFHTEHRHITPRKSYCSFFIRVKNDKKGWTPAPRHFVSILFYNALINLSVKLAEMWGGRKKAI